MLFKPPRKGITIAEDFHDAANIAPDDIPVLDTFELWHPSLAEPIYVVNNFEPLLATKEATAERDPATEVEFIAGKIWLARPTESDQAAAGELDLTITNISGIFSRALRAARGQPYLWQIIERFYNANNTSAPLQTPMGLVVTGVENDNSTTRMRCSFSDKANFGIPRTTYRRVHYPGLVR